MEIRPNFGGGSPGFIRGGVSFFLQGGVPDFPKQGRFYPSAPPLCTPMDRDLKCIEITIKGCRKSFIMVCFLEYALRLFYYVPLQYVATKSTETIIRGSRILR